MSVPPTIPSTPPNPGGGRVQLGEGGPQLRPRGATTASRLRVAIFQPVLARDRVPLFDRLGAMADIDLEVWVGRQPWLGSGPWVPPTSA